MTRNKEKREEQHTRKKADNPGVSLDLHAKLGTVLPEGLRGKRGRYWLRAPSSGCGGEEERQESEKMTGEAKSYGVMH